MAAHDSPEHVIQQLSARIDALGQKPELLWRRAAEYRALGKLDAARSDLKQALKTKPDFLLALVDLSRVYLAKGELRRALSTINRAFDWAQDEEGRAGPRMVRAEIFSAKGDFKMALDDCECALRHSPSVDPEWYLTRSQIQCRLGQFTAAAAGLKQGFEQTGNAVLEAEWIEVMIDAGLFREALERIEPQFAETRWQSSWLLRRARVWLGLGQTSRAHEDLLAAIRELNQRLNGAQPDTTLLADRALAYSLLGDAPLARRDLNAAKKLGAESWALQRAEFALAAQR